MIYFKKKMLFVSSKSSTHRTNEQSRLKHGACRR